MKKVIVGIVFMVAGLIMIGLMFIPMISIHHPNSAGFVSNGGSFQGFMWRTYSPFQFISMLFSSNYDLRNYNYIGVLFVLTLFICVAFITTGIILLVQYRKLRKITSSKE